MQEEDFSQGRVLNPTLISASVILVPVRDDLLTDEWGSQPSLLFATLFNDLCFRL